MKNYTEELSNINNKIKILNEVYFNHDKKLSLAKEQGRLFTLYYNNDLIFRSMIPLSELKIIVDALYASWLYRMTEL